MSNWSLESRADILEGTMTAEMSNINMNYAMMPYTYAYMLRGIFTGQPNALMKVISQLCMHIIFADKNIDPWFN